MIFVIYEIKYFYVYFLVAGKPDSCEVTDNFIKCSLNVNKNIVNQYKIYFNENYQFLFSMRDYTPIMVEKYVSNYYFKHLNY